MRLCLRVHDGMPSQKHGLAYVKQQTVMIHDIRDALLPSKARQRHCEIGLLRIIVPNANWVVHFGEPYRSFDLSMLLEGLWYAIDLYILRSHSHIFKRIALEVNTTHHGKAARIVAGPT
jgi:hypothetical protein